MKTSVDVILKEYDLELLEEDFDRISIFIDDAKKLNRICSRLNKLTKGIILRVISSEEFEKKSCGDVLTISFPGSLKAKYLDLIKWTNSGKLNDARKAGVNLAKKSKNSKILVCANAQKFSEELIKGYLLRRYEFSNYKTIEEKGVGSVTFMLKRPKHFEKSLSEIKAVVDGVFFTRNLVNEPANILNTFEFSNRLKELATIGVDVEILEEKKLAELGMNAILGVGQGSANPSKVVVMSWNGCSQNSKPLALVGKGVVFYT